MKRAKKVERKHKPKSNEEILQEAYDKGFRYMRGYAWCAPCVYKTLQEIFNLKNGPVVKALTGLAGGVGCLVTGPCGAFTGGAAAISAIYGRSKVTPLKEGEWDYSKHIDLIYELSKKFKEEYGSYICQDMQKKVYGRVYNFMDPKELAEFDEAHLKEYRCAKVVGNAAKWTAEILLKEKKPR